MASMPDNRRCRFLTSCGSNVALRSQATWILIAPTLSVTTIFDLVPLRELPLPRPTGSCLS